MFFMKKRANNLVKEIKSNTHKNVKFDLTQFQRSNTHNTHSQSSIDSKTNSHSNKSPKSELLASIEDIGSQKSTLSSLQESSKKKHSVLTDKFQTIQEELSESYSEMNQNGNSKQSKDISKKEPNVPKKKSEERLIIIVDVKAVFKNIQSSNLVRAENSEITTHVFATFPYIEVKGNDNFKQF